ETQVDNLNGQIKNLLDELKKANESADKRQISPHELNARLEQFDKEIEATIRANLPVPSNPFTEGDSPSEPADQPPEGDDSANQPQPPPPPQVSDEIWEEPAPVSRGGVTRPRQFTDEGDASTTSTGRANEINIRVIGQKKTQADEGEQPGEKTGVYLPAGSIVTGVMITGMDAPTHNAARTEPFPSLIRVKKEAILHNRFRADVRECFIIASGYGSLSAERAYLRAETLSRVRADGGVIEVALNAYAVGEDGKVGLRGRVVSKQGQMLAKSLAAGFFSGMSQVFNRAPVPTIQTTNS